MWRFGVISAFALLCATECRVVGRAQASDGWVILDRLPGAPDACSARHAGEEVDTMLMVNRADKLILTAGRSDWRHQPGTEKATLQIDNLKLENQDVNLVLNLALYLVADDTVLDKLKFAKDLSWTFSFGTFHTSVDGLGAAMDDLKACLQSKKSANQ